jgi:hypothetical protein
MKKIENLALMDYFCLAHPFIALDLLKIEFVPILTINWTHEQSKTKKDQLTDG